MRKLLYLLALVPSLVFGTTNNYNILDNTSATISGGTIDGTPIGQTTPAAGSFTTLSTTGASTFGGNLTITKFAPTFLLNGTSGTADQIAFQNNGSNSVGWNLVYALTPNWFGIQNLTTGNYSIKIDGATDLVTLTGALTVAGNTTLSGLTANSFLYSGTAGLLTTTAAPTNGQLLIGSTGAAPVAAVLTGTANQVNVTNGAGSITLSTPQSIATSSSPTFAGLSTTGNVNVQGNLSSATNTSPASTTNSGVSVTAGSNFGDIDFYDSTQTANNRTASWIYLSGAFRARFYNDAHSAALEPLVMTGGQAGGITAIASNSGSGAWTHTGAFTVSGAFTPSTTAGVVGTTAADNANTGSDGEFVSNSSTGTSLTSGATMNATSISLAAGDWNCWGQALFLPAASTVVANVAAGITTTSATLPAAPDSSYLGTTLTTGTSGATTINPMIKRVNVSSTTTVYLVAEAGSVTVSTATVNGYIQCRRAR